jgi:hypothetical protein
MDFSDIAGFVQKAAPWIAAAATSNVPALIGLAANAVSGATGKPVDPTASAVQQAIATASPEALLRLKAADDELKLKAQAMGFAHEEEMAKLGIEEETLFVGDTNNARIAFKGDPGVFWLGIATILAFAVLMSFLLWGCYAILTKGIDIKDQGTVAVVFSLIGTVVGYLASNAQQVYGYFYGSSKGSQEKTQAMGDAIKTMATNVNPK